MGNHTFIFLSSLYTHHTMRQLLIIKSLSGGGFAAERVKTRQDGGISVNSTLPMIQTKCRAKTTQGDPF